MAFGDDDLRAMMSDFPVPVVWRGVRVGVGIVDSRPVISEDAAGMNVQRSSKVLRVRAGLLAGWRRDEIVTVGGTRYRLREPVDNPQSIDGAFDFISVGAA